MDVFRRLGGALTSCGRERKGRQGRLLSGGEYSEVKTIICGGKGRQHIPGNVAK